MNLTHNGEFALIFKLPAMGLFFAFQSDHVRLLNKKRFHV